MLNSLAFLGAARPGWSWSGQQALVVWSGAVRPGRVVWRSAPEVVFVGLARPDRAGGAKPGIWWQDGASAVLAPAHSRARRGAPGSLE